MRTIVLLIVSNVFMTTAWYWHLKFHHATLWRVILISWLIAGVEYCLAVPANRYGHVQGFSAPQLKTMQEIITLVVFALFSAFYLREKLEWNHAVGFGLIVMAAFFVFYKW